MQVRETHNAIKQFQKEIYEAEDWDTVQKLYRQCRMWVRGQVSYAHSLTQAEGWYINAKINATRKEVLAKWRKSHTKEYSYGRKKQSGKDTYAQRRTHRGRSREQSSRYSRRTV